jgi:hypothetical protein
MTGKGLQSVLRDLAEAVRIMTVIRVKGFGISSSTPTVLRLFVFFVAPLDK